METAARLRLARQQPDMVLEEAAAEVGLAQLATAVPVPAA
jgi:hypothetical protein